MLRRAALVALLQALLPVCHGERRMAPEALVPQEPRQPGWRLRRLSALAAVASAVLSPSVGAQVMVDMDTETLDTNGDGFVDKEEFMLCARDAVDDRGEVVRSRSALFNYAAGLYDAIDIDGNGLLSSEELKYGQFLSSALSSSAETSQEALEKGFGAEMARDFLTQVDTNKDSRVDRAEFDTFVNSQFDIHDGGRSEEAAKIIDDVFARVDLTGDGFLGERELHHSVFVMYEVAVKSMADIIRLDFDLDGDGGVDLAEVEHQLVYGKPWQSLRAERIREKFDEADLDGDGTLDTRETYLLALRVGVGDV